MIQKNLVLLLCLCFGIFVNAQDDRQIITESGTPLEDIYIDDVVKRTLVEEAPVLEYQPLREADVVWQTRIWRVIDVREKMNIAFRAPLKPFFSILTELAQNGDIAVFKDETFREPMTIDDIDKVINRIDTTTVFDYDTYEEQIKVVKNTINWEDVKQFRLKEIWYFDKETSTFNCRILGISPILDEIDPDTGELKYSLPLFWVYYPEAREHFAKHRILNDFNEIAPMSWYDLFEARFFSSFIMKQSNTLDLRIVDLYEGYDRAGVHRLMESDKIKAELFNFEHDLWEY